MSTYTPPVSEMVFALYDVLGFENEDLDRETVQSVLEEAAKLSSEMLAPLNHTGDTQGAVLKEGQVKTADGFKEAYKTYCEGGWNAVPFDPQYDGQGLPWAVAFPIQEMWQGANMSFGLCPLLNQGAIEAICSHGSDAQKEYYLPKLISGEWTGTMNLTEPQAGSDLGLIRCKAEKQSDNSYKITGQKIFITYGDHDMTENIIHLVLARTTDAPDDVAGISLFIVPKILDDGARNAVNCIGLEHKLGIHASPTCTMDFDGATGYLIGEENNGLKYMFTMMNNARLSVGLQGVAIADRAMQQAWNYAKERVQGKCFSSQERVSIDKHPDVKRMLMEMLSLVTSGRLMTYESAMAIDSGDEDYVGFLTPIVKLWCTDMAVHVASLGVQAHGGMGYIEETGAAQYYRDARILPIYEGTNGIQAMDFVFRKVIHDEGAQIFKFIDKANGIISPESADVVRTATNNILKMASAGKNDEIAWHATPYLKGISYVFAEFMLAKARQTDGSFMNTNGIKIEDVENFYKCSILRTGYAQMYELANKA